MKNILIALLLGVFLLSTPVYAGKEKKTIENAVLVLDEIMAIPEKGIPPALLTDAHAIAIIPGTIKVGFVIGGRHGRGVLSLRQGSSGWSNPSFISFSGGSIGWQIGAQSTDIILVFKSSRSVEDIMDGKFTLGADASIAAGPVGRQAEAATDIEFKAEIYSYSRNRGLFAGLSLEGAALSIDWDANEDFYRKEGLSPSEIFDGKGLSTPPGAQKLKETIARYSGK